MASRSATTCKCARRAVAAQGERDGSVSKWAEELRLERGKTRAHLETERLRLHDERPPQLLVNSEGDRDARTRAASHGEAERDRTCVLDRLRAALKRCRLRAGVESQLGKAGSGETGTTRADAPSWRAPRRR